MGDHFNYYNAAARRSNTLYGVHTASYSLVGGRTAERHGNKMIRALPANHNGRIGRINSHLSKEFGINNAFHT
ncbi:unnamed protein product [Haemonchus placei]|uniref:Transposase n=1 Tax=Haemonchus placei TaxID=6290 RepID=A0A0N4WQD5_HAEPC|nr:unnamed protein product [Haemonchus placei]